MPFTPDLEDLFVGREAELALAMDAVASAARLIWIRGPAGVGKTELLSRIARTCRDRELPYYWLAPRVEPPTSAVLSAIARDLGRGGADRRILLIDDFELLRSIEQWFVERFLPLLPPHVSVVVAARAPMPRLPADELAAIDLALPQLSDEDIEHYLERRGVPAERHASLIAMAEGNPGLLETALAASERGRPPDADACGCTSLHVRHDTDHHRLAVAVLVAARATTYELLELAFDDAREAGEAYCWLARLAIVEQTPRGLRPHTMYRKCCERELARYAPQIWDHARRVVREFASHRIAVASDPFHWVLDRLFVDRDLAAVREHVELPATDYGLAIDRARYEDRQAILEVAAARSGEPAIMGYWLDDEAAELDVLRDARGAICGYLCSRVLGAASAAPAATPAVALASQHLQAAGWFGAATPPDASALVLRCGPVVSSPLGAKLGHAMLLARMACRLIETPALEFLFVVADRPDHWRRLLRFLGVDAHPVGELGRGEARRVLLAADWRPFSIAAALDRAAAASERAELAGAAEGTWPALESTSLSAMLTQRIADLARATGLSRREQEVLHLLVLGRNTAEIGVALHITARTARFHQTNVLEKIGAESRLDVIRLLM